MAGVIFLPQVIQADFFAKSWPKVQGALEKMSLLRGPFSGDLTAHTFFIESGKGLTEASF